MPNSIRENNADVRSFVRFHAKDVRTALDVGPGEGTYYNLLHDLVPTMDAVEIWAQNITDFALTSKYRDVWNQDARTFAFHFPGSEDYDLIIFGDVLEHLSVEDAVSVFTRARAASKWVLVSVPIIHFPQGEIDGNHAETHLIEDPLDELIPLLGTPEYTFKYQYTGTFIYRGDLR